MRRADCISASVPVAALAIGHAASNVRSTQLSGTDSDSCDTASVTRPSLTDAVSVVGPPFSPTRLTVAMTSPASALASSSSSPRTAASRTAVGEHLHLGGAQAPFGQRHLHRAVDHRAHRHFQPRHRHFVAQDAAGQQQLQRARRFGAHEIGGHRHGERRPAREQVGRRGQRQQRLGELVGGARCHARPAAGGRGRGCAAAAAVLRRQVGGFGQLAGLFLVHALDQARHLAEPGGNGGGQALAAGDQAVAAAARLHQDRLQHAVPLDRFHERCAPAAGLRRAPRWCARRSGAPRGSTARRAVPRSARRRACDTPAAALHE